jgi:hypothetical protein
MQWKSFGMTETPDDGCLRLKHVLKGSDRNSCIVGRVILCVTVYKNATFLSVLSVFYNGSDRQHQRTLCALLQTLTNMYGGHCVMAVHRCCGSVFGCDLNPHSQSLF